MTLLSNSKKSKNFCGLYKKTLTLRTRGANSKLQCFSLTLPDFQIRIPRPHTDKSLSEAPFLHQLTHNMKTDCSLNYTFSTWKLQAQNMLRTFCVHKLVFCFCFDIQNNQCTQNVLSMFWACNLMDYLLSYCGLVDARISASEKYLLVHTSISIRFFSAKNQD